MHCVRVHSTYTLRFLTLCASVGYYSVEDYCRLEYDNLVKMKQCFGRKCSLHFMVVYPEDENSTFPHSSFISQRRQSYLCSQPSEPSRAFQTNVDIVSQHMPSRCPALTSPLLHSKLLQFMQLEKRR